MAWQTQKNFFFIWVTVLLTIAMVLTLTMSGCSKTAPEQEPSNTETTAQVESPAQIFTQCTDSDLGKDTTVKGKVSLGNQSFLDKCVSTFVIEYYCEEGQISSQNFRCEKDCDSGACI